MITLRKSDERGHADHGWLDTRHTFSFADYHDSDHTHFRSLRVINEDHIAGGAGFGMHPHRDMEILTYLLSGAIRHRDSLGHGDVIRPGDVQRMSAGSGITHSEANDSPTVPVHLLQIWVFPEQKEIAPSYEQKSFGNALDRGDLCLIAAPGGRAGALAIHQDVSVFAGRIKSGERTAHSLAAGRHAWLQLARGRIRLNGVELLAGDGAAVSDELRLEIEVPEAAELLLFDLA
ncbi:MAG: pirin family protein [Pedosphaera sp.]|nr:pirin family protein [Pedosphaera sp.]MST00457.1 pirin family protein [Pedosphaera sp.]